MIDKLIMVTNIASILLFLSVIAILSNKESFKMFKLPSKFKTTLLYKIPLVIFIFGIILNTIGNSSSTNWIITIAVLAIPISAYITDKSIKK